MHNMRDTSAKDLKTKSLSHTLTSFTTCSICFIVFSSSCTSTTRAAVAVVRWTTLDKGKGGVRILNDVLRPFHWTNPSIKALKAFIDVSTLMNMKVSHLLT